MNLDTEIRNLDLGQGSQTTVNRSTEEIDNITREIGAGVEFGDNANF